MIVSVALAQRQALEESLRATQRWYSQARVGRITGKAINHASGLSTGTRDISKI